ncbi:hypothetical protein CLOAM0574 [Candidatus Cloacimonas acidaminovorans str. Evry]|uniref:Uncharacterized protein n=1 Tax=Cloacimonas acidaminovorans (strain Evry) TaxID=459349 RepID=B0VGM4_CLOAI|nr:hypothetical protein CLOAM0574 [Candidatus Cloacimonas acidaminovorans str. Evry]
MPKKKIYFRRFLIDYLCEHHKRSIKLSACISSVADFLATQYYIIFILEKAVILSELVWISAFAGMTREFSF